MSRRSSSKWSKYKVLKKSQSLVRYLPATYPLKKKPFWRLLNQYDEVIVKPTGSYGGRGVLLIKALGGQKFLVRAGAKRKKITGTTKLLNYVRPPSSKNLIVQQRISLATINGRPFDLRVMVQRLRKSSWEITGKLAKVAGKGYIITNMRRSHGSILPVKKAIQRSQLKSLSTHSLLAHIDQVALLTAKQLKSYYPRIRSIGIDLGLDKSGKVWIIEANFKPAASLFLNLKDKSMYRRIRFFSK
ncbi:YheC/YheD family protein [Paenibacillus agricola]|uniref:YheC/D-like protein n=1 Tax=Paenibacillus agricola TaxID=2716264 RepID=A0ABX0J2F2_9BACL|nr:YheC/YheD family protein [Paenibacillus agricola]NHN30485.1 hypothetical protein [Paenibacillus agricola]